MEQQFGVRRFSLADPNSAPAGPCLDTLLKFGEVQMSRGAYCLESLFGVDRHNLPKSLPSVRRGRYIFYDLRALLVCMSVLLETGRWVPDPDRRALVLRGIIKRAEHLGEPDVATILGKFFAPRLA
jgi:hypothetical protein